MKRGILILLFIFILACFVSAMTVTLDSPATSTTFTNEVPPSITCTATIGADELLSNLTLYFKNNESTAWHADSIEESMQEGGTKIFSVSGLVNATYEWNCLAISNNNVETWDGSNRTFMITFTEASPPAENNAPTCTVAADTNKTTDEDTGVDIDSDMDASGGIECIDTDADDIIYTVNTQSGAGTFAITGNNLSASPQANATGEGYATIKVDDSNGGIVYVDVQVTWDAVNDPPLVSVISNQTWDENDDKTIDLDDYFSDVDDSSLSYSYTFISSSPDINVTIESDGDATFTPESDWTGTETLTFTAADSSNASVTSNEVILTVEEANETTTNNAPNIDTVSPEADPMISVDESQEFSITKSDLDGDDMNVTWRVDGLLQEGETGDSFTYTASEVGSFIIKVVVSDGQESDKNTWTLTVKTAGGTTNRTVAPVEKETEEQTSVCGDKVCDNDETTTSCCKDCGCPEGWKCSTKTNKCTRENKSKNIILLIVVGVLFVGGAGAGIYFYRKKQEKDIFGLAKTPFKAPPKEEVKKEEVKPQKPAAVVKQPAKKPLKKPKTTSQILLKKYITYNMKKGKSFEQVKKELLKVGWTAEQVDDAYTAAKLDEVFS